MKDDEKVSNTFARLPYFFCIFLHLLCSTHWTLLHTMCEMRRDGGKNRVKKICQTCRQHGLVTTERLATLRSPIKLDDNLTTFPASNGISKSFAQDFHNFSIMLLAWKCFGPSDGELEAESGNFWNVFPACCAMLSTMRWEWWWLGGVVGICAVWCELDDGWMGKLAKLKWDYRDMFTVFFNLV